MSSLLAFLTKIKPLLESLAFISSIGLFTTIIIGIYQIKLLKKDSYDRNKRASVETSLKYLELFANNFIPESSKYEAAYKKEVLNPENTSSLFDGKFNLPMSSLNKAVLAEVIVKYTLGLHNLINQLEYFSVAIQNKIADEDIVFTPISKYFCNYIKKEHVLISVMRNQGAPFRNLMDLYKKWSDRIEVEALELQKQELEHKIKGKGTEYKSSPPIGQ